MVSAVEFVDYSSEDQLSSPPAEAAEAFFSPTSFLYDDSDVDGASSPFLAGEQEQGQGQEGKEKDEEEESGKNRQQQQQQQQKTKSQHDSIPLSSDRYTVGNRRHSPPASATSGDTIQAATATVSAINGGRAGGDGGDDGANHRSAVDTKASSHALADGSVGYEGRSSDEEDQKAMDHKAAAGRVVQQHSTPWDDEDDEEGIEELSEEDDHDWKAQVHFLLWQCVGLNHIEWQY
eukprot:COSAG05_NODE_217_length_13794_cov_5.734064_4_plen_234_part_00